MPPKTHQHKLAVGPIPGGFSIKGINLPNTNRCFLLGNSWTELAFFTIQRDKSYLLQGTKIAQSQWDRSVILAKPVALLDIQRKEGSFRATKTTLKPITLEHSKILIQARPMDTIPVKPPSKTREEASHSSPKKVSPQTVQIQVQPVNKTFNLPPPEEALISVSTTEAFRHPLFAKHHNDMIAALQGVKTTRHTDLPVLRTLWIRE